MSAMTVRKRPDGIAILVLDTPESPVNILSSELFDEFREALDEVESDAATRGCVISSAKKDFIAGANLKELYAIDSASEAEAYSRDGHALLDRIERSRKPFVAAIAGQALGGGLEVALACHYRLAADDPTTIFALPEVTLGLLPGGGGTQRLPRLIGLAAALPLMLTGQRIRARKAYRMGLVDALTSPGGIEETAARAALRLAAGTLAPRRRRRRFSERILEGAPGRAFVFRRACAEVLAKTGGHYPAPLSIIECVRAAYSGDRQAGFETESARFGRLVASREAKALIGIFLGMTELKKPLTGPAPCRIHRLAIIGGGFMGQGIASVSLKIAPVVVKEVSDAALRSSCRSIWEGLDKQLESGSITRFERDRLWARLQPSTRTEEVAGADLIIEAVFEDLALKQEVLADVESHVSETAVLASNTSALPISSIAAHASHPERVLGMHYFSPVPKMPLIELVITDRTAPWALTTARAFAIAQGKTAIVVKDCPGFYTTRILSPLMNEAMVLLEEGARIEEVDHAATGFGYPVGPLTLLDEVGIDVGAHVSTELGSAFAGRGLAASGALPRVHESGCRGRKNGRGFYLYGDKRAKRANPEIYRLVGGPARKAIAPADIADRLALLMINEAFYCLQEGVLASPRDGDVGAILGLGFPPFRGGPFRHVDTIGAAEIVRRMQQLASRHGRRFEPAPLLEESAREGRRIYA